MSHVTSSYCRSLNTLTEVEEHAEMGKLLETGSPQIPFVSGAEIRPEAVGASTNTVQPVLVFDC